MTRTPAGTQTRTAVFEVGERAIASPIPVVLSTDAIVEVRDGPEILQHSEDAIDLSRAPIPIIAAHRNNQVNVGIIEDLKIAGGTLRGSARFGTRQEAQEYERDVLGGIIRSLSVGYVRNRGYMRKEDGVLMVTRWMPTHAAMVAEPADINAGFFRALDSVPTLELSEEPTTTEAGKSPVSEPAPNAVTKEKQMTTEANAAAGGTAAVETRTAPVVEFQSADYGKQEEQRIKDINFLASECKIDARTVNEWIENGIDANSASRAAISIMAERQKHQQKQAASYLGMSTADLGRYSVTRAIKACVEKSWPKVAPYEAEISQQLGRRMGRGESGEYTFFIPLDVQWAAAQQRAQRDLVVGTSSSGGYLVGTNTMSFIEMLRNRSVAIRLGATTMPGLVGSVSIPKQLTSSTGYWFASEAGTATESNLTFGQVTLTPKTVGGYVEISRQLLLQSTPNAEGIVNADLAKVVGLALDTAVLVGPGTAGQPTGIASTSGVGTANPTAGTNVGYADMIKFQTTVAASNAYLPGFGYVTTPTIAGILMGKPRFTNSDTPVWQGNILDGQVVGAPAMTSLQVSSATMFGGDFSQVVIGEWGVLEIEANPYAQFQAGIVGVRALYTVDVAIRYGAAFAIGTGMTA